MFTFNISLAVLLSVALLLSEKKLQVEADECSSNSDCGLKQYCCKRRYPLQENVCCYGGCVGQPCSSNSDCGGPGECCSSSNYCTPSPCHECYSNSDCGYNEYCCKQRDYSQTNVCAHGGCVGQACSSNNDCGGPGECCGSTHYCKNCTECSSNLDCGYNESCCINQQGHDDRRTGRVCDQYGDDGCVGQPCYSDSDCGGPDECCNLSNYCRKSPCHECSSNFDCGWDKYCCKQNYTSWQTNNVCHYDDCVGQFCNSNSDCGGQDECCSSSNECTLVCTNDFKPTNFGFTNWQCYIGPWEECSSDSDCPGFYNYCCRPIYILHGSNVCSSSCVNISCKLDRDCGGPSECCSSSNLCISCDHHVTKGLASWLIAVISVSAFFVAVVIPIIIVCFYRGMASRGGRTQQGQVLNQPTRSRIALLNIQTVQNNAAQLQIPRYPPPPYCLHQGQGRYVPQAAQLLNQEPPPAYTEY